MEEKTGRKWLGRILDFINPLRDPSLTVAAVLTFIEEAGQHDPWYMIIILALVNWLAVRGIVWLVVNFAFASTFISRRIWWAVKNPRLAWRILDAVGHEEIVIGGLPGLSEGVLLHDATAMMSPVLGASGIHIVGELPAGTELPVLGMPNGQMTANLSLGAPGYFTGGSDINSASYVGAGGFNNQPGMGFQQLGNSDFVSSQNTDGLPQSFPQRPSEEEEHLRQQLAAYARLMDDWLQFTEEKWRTVSDSQLGWKPLRGRWSSWDDIFQDAYAAKTSDPMAEAAQLAGEATARRYDTSKDKGSAASAVACFMRDMMTLRRGLDMLQQQLPNGLDDTPTVEPVVPSFNKRFGSNSGSLRNGTSPRQPLIRRPAQIFVDADTDG
ncbi:hypothetical protein EPA93_30910 [Ktedonosporobacter rubrisoli]|uniref:Uncharacterized protein n=1 Tax=Ktedonosporobacter rubrisoli TaxID=2509675 RepID=A0A4P6JXJ5_KTERU|nr:hypothetical protein [Ktedonosporobacter rubrisoli]QBD80152.1 hypothetical protein EPA93_30910 [Ktedonosporobacter rubrisoli]